MEDSTLERLDTGAGSGVGDSGVVESWPSVAEVLRRSPSVQGPHGLELLPEFDALRVRALERGDTELAAAATWVAVVGRINRDPDAGAALLVDTLDHVDRAGLTTAAAALRALHMEIVPDEQRDLVEEIADAVTGLSAESGPSVWNLRGWNVLAVAVQRLGLHTLAHELYGRVATGASALGDDGTRAIARANRARSRTDALLWAVLADSDLAGLRDMLTEPVDRDGDGDLVPDAWLHVTEAAVVDVIVDRDADTRRLDEALAVQRDDQTGREVQDAARFALSIRALRNHDTDAVRRHLGHLLADQWTTAAIRGHVIGWLQLRVAALDSPEQVAPLVTHAAAGWAVAEERRAVFERAVRHRIEVAEQLARQSSLERQVDEDPLTGIANRRGLARHAESTGEVRTVLVIDLDDFKTVNDMHGHAAGDTALRIVADVLSRHARQDDVVARVGGDEFAVLLPSMDAAAARARAARIERDVRSFDWDDVSPGLRVTVSVGGATGVGDLDDLTRRADEAMYAVKAGDGRGGSRVHGMP